MILIFEYIYACTRMYSSGCVCIIAVYDSVYAYYTTVREKFARSMMYMRV